MGHFSTTQHQSNLQSPGSGRPRQSHAVEAGPEPTVRDEAEVWPPSACSGSRRVHWDPKPAPCGTQETLSQGSPDNPRVAGTPNARRHPASLPKQALQTTKHGVPAPGGSAYDPETSVYDPGDSYAKLDHDKTQALTSSLLDDMASGQYPASRGDDTLGTGGATAHSCAPKDGWTAILAEALDPDTFCTDTRSVLPASRDDSVVMLVDRADAETYPLVNRKEEPARQGRPIVCHLTIYIGDVVVDTCVDSGATFSLLSHASYRQAVQSGFAGPLVPSKTRLRGASGKDISLYGTSKIRFRIGSDVQQDEPRATYTYEVLVGELKGVDMLLGLDWLIAASAKIDFGSMTAVIGPRQKVILRTTPGLVSHSGKVTRQNRDAGCLTTFVKTRTKQTLISGHTSLLRLRVEAYWLAGTPGLFEGAITLGNGLEILDGLVTPDMEGNFYVGAVNRTTQDWALDEATILGRLQPLQDVIDGSTPARHPGQHPTPSIWHISEQTARLCQGTSQIEGRGVLPERMHKVFHLETRILDHYEPFHAAVPMTKNH